MAGYQKKYEQVFLLCYTLTKVREQQERHGGPQWYVSAGDQGQWGLVTLEALGRARAPVFRHPQSPELTVYSG